MEIKRTNIEDKKEQYKFIKKPGMLKMSEAKGMEITVGKYAVYVDRNSDGEVHDICAIEDADSGKVYATNSATFIRSFMDILEVIGEANVVKCIGGTTKNGRPYIDCELID